MIGAIVALLFAATFGENVPPRLNEGASATEIMAACRSLVPDKAELKGTVIVSRKQVNSKGVGETIEKRVKYTLKRNQGKTELVEGDIEGTGVTMSDLSLDYLWWDNVAFDPEEKTETLTLFKCARLILKKGERTIRLWVTYKFGSPEQAEELDKEGRVIRRLWGTRIREFGDRWMASRLQVHDMSTNRRTKITVDEIK